MDPFVDKPRSELQRFIFKRSANVRPSLSKWEKEWKIPMQILWADRVPAKMEGSGRRSCRQPSWPKSDTVVEHEHGGCMDGGRGH